MNEFTFKILVFIVSTLPTVALATGPPPAEVIAQNAGVFQWVLGIALVMVGCFLVRTLNNIDRQWKAISALNTRLAHLEGEHHRASSKVSREC